MTQPETAKFLHDMLSAADLLRQFSRGRTLTEYREDPYFRSAVERQFQIVGEALWRISRQDAATCARIPDADLIIRFRHVLVHGYDAIDDQIVWAALGQDLDALRNTVRRLLDEIDAL